MREMKANSAQQYGEYPGANRTGELATSTDKLDSIISGWTTFGGVMLLLAGAFGAINGVIALLNSEVYVATENNIVLFDFTQWGWIHTIGGAVVALTGLIVILSGATWARVIGVVVAVMHAIAQVSFIEAYPFWTMATIALDIAVIYGLLVAPKRTIATA